MSSHDKHKQPLSRNTSWVVDSGATVHCVSNKSMLTSTYENHKPVTIRVADNRVITAKAVGTCNVALAGNDGKRHRVRRFPATRTRCWRQAP